MLQPLPDGASVAAKAAELLALYKGKLQYMLNRGELAYDLFCWVDELTRDYLKKHPDPVPASIQISFYDAGQLDGGDLPTISQMLFLQGFDVFLRNINNPLKIVYKAHAKPLSPQAFDYTGHNKVSVKKSHHIYSLLFQ